MKIKNLRRALVQPLVGLVAALAVLAVHFLPHRWLAALGRAGGTAAWLLPPVRRLILANLRVALPDRPAADHRRLGKTSLQNLLRGGLEFFWVLGNPDRHADVGEVDPDFLALYHRLRAEHGPVLILLPHLGSWEFGSLLAGDVGIPVSAIAREQPNPTVERLARHSRESLGTRIIHEKGAARAVRQAFRNGRNVAMLVDQNTRPSHGGIFVDYFGLPTTMSRAPAVFARYGDVPVLLCACRRGADHRLHFVGEQLDTATAADDAAFCQHVRDRIEARVRADPDQYLWAYRYWRYIPADTPLPPDRFPYYARPYVNRRKKTAD